MSIHKYLIKLNNKLESGWEKIDPDTKDVVSINAGWYITEFHLDGLLDHVPLIQIRNSRGNSVERALVGGHSGRNRMLIYLPEGELTGYSKLIRFEKLARVSTLEARARILLICFRYLVDFFSIPVLFKMIVMQFQDPFELSSNLLRFYEPAGGKDSYLQNIVGWRKFRGFERLLSWLGRGVKLAVVIEDDSQRAELAELLVQPDAVLMAGDTLPASIDYCIPLARSEHLREPAIIMFKRAIKNAPNRPRLVYSDHDYVNEGEDIKPLHPVFKPSPSPAYLHCFNYVGFALVLSSQDVNQVGTDQIHDARTQYDLLLAAFKQPEQVLHVSEALFLSERKSELSTPEPTKDQSPWPHIQWQRSNDHNVLVADPEWHDQPSVDLIIPTRDGLNVLKPCIDSILEKTRYTNFTVIVVDNGSELPETHDYFAQIQTDERVSVVEYPGEFNYSAINNFAVSTGQSQYIALVNNDIEVIDDHWLNQMMIWAIQDSVGVVGAKLLFSNGKVQHAGVTIGMGNAAGHIHRLEDGDAPGYQLRCLATQNMMAVTAACLVTPRSLFEQLGGLNETEFKVAYNDIDYCLRVEQSGKEIIWTPQARLYHHESVSRGDDMSDKHIERYFRELEVFQSRWKSKGYVDKYYSRHLRISDEGVFPQIEQRNDGEMVFLNEVD